MREDGRDEETARSAEEEEESEGYDESSASSAEVDELYPMVCKQFDRQADACKGASTGCWRRLGYV